MGDVHTRHCCILHGCKYGDEGCTVQLGAKQERLCELCEGDDLETLTQVKRRANGAPSFSFLEELRERSEDWPEVLPFVKFLYKQAAIPFRSLAE